MKKAIALVVALLGALAVAWGLSRSSDGADARKCAEVESWLKKGDLAQARRVVDEARPRLSPHVADYLDAVVELTATQGDPARAKEHERAAREAAERAYAGPAAARDDWRIVSIVFWLRGRAGDLPGARAALDDYVARHPQDDRALVASAQYWLLLVPAGEEDPERALEALDRAAKVPAPAVPPHDPTSVTPELIAELRGRAESLRGARVAAITQAEKRVAAAPQDAAAHAQLAEAYRKADRTPEAVEAWRTAIRLDPSSFRYRAQFANYLLDVEVEGTEADQVTRELLASSPQDPEARLLRARALARREAGAGIDEAIDIYRRLREEDGSLPPELRLAWRRNLAVALYDWKQGGRPGPYLDEAHGLLAEYLRLGGKMDSRLSPVWEKLERRARESGSPVREPR